MILELDFTNRLDIPIVLNALNASGQPLKPGESVAVMVEMQEGNDGIAHLTLFVDKGR